MNHWHASLLLLAFAPLASANLQAYETGRYFDLLPSLNQRQTSVEGRFGRGVALAGVNRLAEACRELEGVVGVAPPKLRRAVLDVLITSYIRSGRYARAVQTVDLQLKLSAGLLSAKEKEDLQNSRNLCASLVSVPPMRTSFGQASRLKSSSAFSLPFFSGGKRFDLMADTGANLSLVREGIAREMGLRLIPTNLKVGSITGEQVSARLGVADELRFGETRVLNAVFLVMKDEDLSFPAANFRLDGVIGLPVMMALGKTTFFRSGEVEISKGGGPSRPNMFIAGLKPFVEGRREGHSMTFSLDTGADDTMLYPPFLKLFRKEIEATGFRKIRRVMGVAGHKDTPAFLLTNLEIKLAGRAIVLPTVDVLGVPRERGSEKFFGNIGRDIFAEVESVTLDWTAMQMTLGRRVSQ